MTIGNRLKQFAEQNFDRLQDFAAALGMKLPSLYDYFNGKTQPGTPILLKLHNLGCDINWLLTGEKSRYIPNPEENNIPKLNQFRVLGTVPAGHGEVYIQEWVQTEVMHFDPRDHDLLQIDEEFGYSMTPVMKPGDLVLISYSAKIVNGDKVAARWDKTKGAIKIVSFLKDDPSMIVLTSSNVAVEPIFLKRKKVIMYKVVGWFDRQSIKNRQ
jgi:phage repressor protein C with HTH and peptisase S24 domain